MTITKGVLGGAVVITMLGSQIAGTSATRTEQTTSAETVTARIDQLMVQQDCSYTGFGADVIPATALLRTTTDDVRVVSFARGWAAYQGEKPGTLIAVCRGAR